MLNEQDLKREILAIQGGDGSPMAKARKLLGLRRRIDAFAKNLQQNADSFEGSEPEETRLRADTAKALRRLQEEARLAAFRILRARPVPLGLYFETDSFASPAAFQTSAIVSN